MAPLPRSSIHDDAIQLFPRTPDHDGAIALRPRAAILVALVMALGACGGDGGRSVTRTDSAGVSIVVTEGPDRPLAWRFRERLRLGGADEGPQSFYALSRSLVAADGEGRIYVLDESAHRVVVFDAQGEHVRTLGREGGGPGELEMPVAVAAAEGVVGVWDYGKSGVVRFGPDGEPLPTLTSNAFYGGRGLALRPTGAVFTTTDMRDPATLREALVVLDTTVAGPEGWRHIRPVSSIPMPDAPPHRFEACAIAFRLPPLFYPDVEWAQGPRGRLFVNDQAGWVVDVYRETAHVASYRRALEPRPATRALAERSLGEGMTVSVSGGPPCTIPPDEVLDARGYADRVPFMESIVVDPEGRVWVERAAIGDEPARVDILAPDGAYLGTLLDPPIPLAFLPDGDVLARETDALEVDRLVVYRVSTE